MDDALFAHTLLVVTGKGGVGKSTVAGALGMAASRRGLRTIVVEVAARDDVSGVLGSSDAARARARQASGGLCAHLSIDPQRAMQEYLREQLPVGALATLLSRSRVFAALTAATPGMRELLTMGKVWELAVHGDGRGGPPYDLVVLDAPATGHGLAMLQSPRTFASVARVGPVAKQAREISSFLRDERRTAVLAVAMAEEMPVTETLELRAQLKEQLRLDLAQIVVNAVITHRFSERDRRTLRAAPPSPARHAALFAAGWASRQRAQIARLRRDARDVGLVTLPFVFDSALDAAALEALSLELDP